MDLDRWIIQQKEKDPAFTQRKMANDMGINEHTITHVVRGRFPASFRVIDAIADYTKGEVTALEMFEYSFRLWKEKSKKESGQ